MKTYVFRVVVEPDEDRWVAFCPALERYAATTWGYTRKEALKNIQEVAEIVLQELVEEEESIPEELSSEDSDPSETRVAVTI